MHAIRLAVNSIPPAKRADGFKKDLVARPAQTANADGQCEDVPPAGKHSQSSHQTDSVGIS